MLRPRLWALMWLTVMYPGVSRLILPPLPKEEESRTSVVMFPLLLVRAIPRGEVMLSVSMLLTVVILTPVELVVMMLPSTVK